MPGFKDMSTCHYSDSKAESRTVVYLNLSDEELKELKTWVDTRTYDGTPLPGSVAELELKRDGLYAQVQALNKTELLQKEIKSYETVLEASRETEERKRFPHVFGNVSGICLYCDAETGFFGRNEGKPCATRYREEKDKKDAGPLQIRLVLKRRGHFHKIMFTTLGGALLPPGQYQAQIAEIKVDNES